jgi:hypothetical protein
MGNKRNRNRKKNKQYEITTTTTIDFDPLRPLSPAELLELHRTANSAHTEAITKWVADNVARPILENVEVKEYVVLTPVPH